MIETEIKKLGRPFTKRVYPILPLTEPQIRLMRQCLKNSGGFLLPFCGIVEIREIKEKRTLHNFSGKMITIRGRKKLHIVNLPPNIQKL